jgi:hypothetical protein
VNHGEKVLILVHRSGLQFPGIFLHIIIFKRKFVAVSKFSVVFE